MNTKHTKILLILLLTVNTHLTAQVEQNQKLYWDYRDRLKSTFMKIGPQDGESLPMEWFDFDGDCRFIPGTTTPYNKGVIHWADATAYLGDYIAVLATEYKLLQLNGQNVQPTLNELYYALNAINRIDDDAEFYLSQQSHSPDRNGFIERDDVESNFKSNWTDRYAYSQDRRDYVTAVSSTHGKEIETSPCQDFPGGFFNPANEESQDQLIYLLMGMSLVKKMVDNVYVKPTTADAGFYIVAEAESITTRLTDYVFSEQDFDIPFNQNLVTLPLILTGLPVGPLALTLNPSSSTTMGYLNPSIGLGVIIPTLSDPDLDFYDATYCITNPLYNGLVESGGGLMQPFAYPLTKCVEYITGRTSFPPVKADVHLENITVPISAPVTGDPKDWWEDYRDNSAGFETYIMDLGSLGEWEIDMNFLFSRDYNKHMLLLMAAMSNTWSNAQIRTYAAPHTMLLPELLHSALHNIPVSNTNASYYKSFLDNAPCEGPSEFAANGWNHPNRWSSPNTFRQGYYDGLDYMLFYNLYRLAFEPANSSLFAPYKNNVSCPCTFTTIIEGAPYTFGSNQLIVNNTTSGILQNSITLLPKFLNGSQNEYAEKGISAPEYLSMDLKVQGSGKLKVFTELVVCNNSTLEIENNEGLVVGNGSMQRGLVRIRSGSTLKLKANSKIIINTPSEIIVEPGGHLIYEGGAYIVLQGKDALFDVQDNATSIVLNASAFNVMNGTAAQGGTFKLAGGTFTMTNNSNLFNEHCTVILGPDVTFTVNPDATFTLLGADALVDVESITTNITLNSGNNLIMSGIPGIQNGELFLKGGIFTINNGGRLYNYYCTMHFGAQMDFRYNQGASVELNGNESVLDIGGDLFIGNNATFTFTSPAGVGTGFIRMSAPAYWINGTGSINIWAGTHSRFDLRGLNKQDKILEIAQETLYDPTAAQHLHGNLDLFKIVAGTVEFAGGHALGYADGARLALAGSAWLSNVHFKNRDFDTWRTVVTFGQNNVFITGCDFEGADAGFTAALYPLSRNSITNCNFYNCTIGIRKLSGGLDISTCTFHDCLTAYMSTAGLFTDNLTLNTVYDCSAGFDFSLGTAMSQYNLTKNNLFLNYDPVILEGGTVNARCNTVSGNYYYAFDISDHGNLNMNSARNAGYNDFSHNDLAYIANGDPAATFALNGAGMLDLQDGFNNLTPYSSPGCMPASSWCNAGCHDIFVGSQTSACQGCASLYYPPCDPTGAYPVLNADNNQWLEGSVLPFNSALCFDNLYNADASCASGGQPVNVQDASPVLFPSCGYHDPGSGHTTQVNPNNPVTACTTCRQVTVSPGVTMRLDSALKAGLSLMSAGTAQYTQAITLFSSVLNSHLVTPANPKESALLEMTYAHLNEALAKAIESKQVLVTPPYTAVPAKAATVLNIIKSRIAKAAADNIYHTRLYSVLDLADAFRAIGMRDSSLALYNSLLAFANTSDLPMIQKWICYVTSEKAYVKGMITIEEFLQQAAQCIPPRISLRQSAGLAGPGITGSDREQKKGIAIFPNPATEQIEVSFATSERFGFAQDKPSYKEVCIFDCIGNRVASLHSSGSRVLVDVSAYSKGVYVLVALCGSEVYTEKFAVD